MMLMIALKTSAAHQRSLESHRLTWINDSPLAPPIAIIAPAHNEEGSIRVAVRNLLELDYPELELIVVNDGSEDGTLEEMREKFSLAARPRGIHSASQERAGARTISE